MKKKTMRYYSNKLIRSKIDKLLHEMNCIIASKGTNARQDYGNKTKEKLKEIEIKIKEIDIGFYDVICPYGY